MYSEDFMVLRAQQDFHLMDKLKGEAADIAITLFRFAGALGFDLLEEVERKQAINEKRKWKRHGDGTGQHIKNTDT
jgi:NTP pyrophosphatase (non-canonical NTP hydrolase)